MSKNIVDLVVIGAGASGASIAYEASIRGLKVALIDSGDISGGTSCRSTKLLHGGVRYLELAFKQLNIDQLKLVREALLERGYWLSKAPFLAKPLELTLPSRNYFDKVYYRVGLGLYDALSGKQRICPSRLISDKELQKNIPLLDNSLNGGVSYSDGQFNDARLNLLIALTAEKAGATIRTYTEVVSIELNRATNKITGVISKDISGKEEFWETNLVVNATGIKADSLRRMVDNSLEKKIMISRGTHIVLEQNLCPKKMGVLIPSTEDGRVLFVLPFFNRTLIGTTDQECKTSDSFKPSDSEKKYLIKYLKMWFPSLGDPKIKSSWAGARPLIKSDSNSINSSRLVREHIIETLPCGLISALGGKWTTCRTIAKDTLRAVEIYLNKSIPNAKDCPLIGSNKNYRETRNDLLKQRKELKEYLPDTKMINQQIEHLQQKYGVEAINIIKSTPQEKRTPLSEVIPICQTEIEHDIKNEYARTPTDILARRSRLAMVDIDEAQRILPIVQQELVKSSQQIEELNLEN